jgi:hypothetical protein
MEGRGGRDEGRISYFYGQISGKRKRILFCSRLLRSLHHAYTVVLGLGGRGGEGRVYSVVSLIRSGGGGKEGEGPLPHGLNNLRADISPRWC